MRLYQAAVEKLGSILENGKSALSEYLEGQVQKSEYYYISLVEGFFSLRNCTHRYLSSKCRIS